MVQPIVRNLTSSQRTFCLKRASNAGSVEDAVPSKSAIDLTLSLPLCFAAVFPIRDPRWLCEDFAPQQRDWLLPVAKYLNNYFLVPDVIFTDIF